MMKIHNLRNTIYEEMFVNGYRDFQRDVQKGV